jgi:hypothetical protein
MKMTDELEIIILKPIYLIERFVSDLNNIHLWTGHQSVFQKDDNTFKEIRLHAIFDLVVSSVGCKDNSIVITFHWSSNILNYSVDIILKPSSPNITKVMFDIDREKFDAEKLSIFLAELRMLKSMIEKTDYPEKATDRYLINCHHLNLYQREIN